MDERKIFQIKNSWPREYLLSNRPEYIPSCYNSLNLLIDGFYKGNLYIIGARPGIGKTTFIINLCRGFNNQKVLLFTTEMSKEQFIEKFISLLSGIEYREIRQNFKSLQDILLKELDKLGNYNIYICDEYHPTIEMIENSIKILSPDLVMIDYFQNLKINYLNINRYSEYSKNVECLFNIGRKYSVPIIITSQLKRFNDPRVNNRPELSDFKESGRLEETAHVAILLSKSDNDILVDIAKNRNGIIKEFVLKSDWATNKLYESTQS